jgi:uridylate kinase
MRSIVVSLGGSTLYREGKIDAAFVLRVAKIFKNFASQGNRLVVVVGGGILAKKAADSARERGFNDYYADKAAIDATRENAAVLLKTLGNSAVGVVTHIDDAMPFLERGKIVVSGGMHPGLTTDSTSVLFAEAIGADSVVNVSNIDGLYDSDPKTNSKAKRFDKLSHQQLVDLAIKFDDRRARANFVFDIVACKLAARSKIKVFFTSKDKFIGLEKIEGTTVS